jgi:hypothetical protein
MASLPNVVRGAEEVRDLGRLGSAYQGKFYERPVLFPPARCAAAPENGQSSRSVPGAAGEAAPPKAGDGCARALLVEALRRLTTNEKTGRVRQ